MKNADVNRESKKPAVAGELATVPLGEIYADDASNARKVYDPDVVADLAASLARRGQLSPLIVYEDPRRGLVLTDGFTRMRAFQHGWPDTWRDLRVDVRIVPPARAGDEAIVGLEANSLRSSLRTVDLAAELTRLSQPPFAYNHVYLAQVSGMPQSSVARLVSAYTRLAPEVRRQWHAAKEGTLPTSTICAWAKMDPEEQRQAFLTFTGEPADKSERARTKPRPKGRGIRSMQAVRMAIAALREDTRPEAKIVLRALRWVLCEEADCL